MYGVRHSALGVGCALWFVAAAGLAAAQGPPATASISGTVTSAATDAPVARARVTLTSTALLLPRLAISGADGGYSFTGLPPGEYRIEVARTGFVPQTFTPRDAASAVVPLAAGQPLAGVDVALAEAAVIAGRLLDEDGSPLGGAAVQALVPRIVDGARTLSAVASARTTDRGEFRLAGLPAGEYYVSATDPALDGIGDAAGPLYYPPTFYPGVSSERDAKPVMAAPAASADHVEFRLRIVPPASVSGSIRTPDGRPLLNGAVVMRALDPGASSHAPTEDVTLLPDGRFTFGRVPPGRYQLRARGQTASGGPGLFATFALTVDGRDVSDIRLILEPGAALEGRIAVDPESRAQPPPLSSLHVRAPFLDGTRFDDAVNVEVREDGSFAVRGLMTGTHAVLVEGLPAPWVVKRVLYRGRDIADGGFDAASGLQVRDVRIVITDAASDVSGTVRDAHDDLVPSAAVIVFSAAPQFRTTVSRRVRLVHAGADGRFDVRGLPPGDYFAAASTTIGEQDLAAPDTFERLRAGAARFTIEADEAITLDLRLPGDRTAPRVLR